MPLREHDPADPPRLDPLRRHKRGAQDLVLRVLLDHHEPHPLADPAPEGVLKEYPDLEREDIEQALERFTIGCSPAVTCSSCRTRSGLPASTSLRYAQHERETVGPERQAQRA